MSLSIRNNVSGDLSYLHVMQSENSLAQTTERLSSGLRINRAADRPSGLIVSERLRAQVSGLNQAAENSQRAANIVATAEGALDEVSSLLTSIRGLAVEAASDGGLDDDQIQSNQDEVDAALATIDRIANSTSFGGRNLLNGQASVEVQGATPNQLTDYTIRGANFGAASTISVVVNVTQQAERANATGTISATATEDIVVRISGKDGSEVFSFASGTIQADAITAINALSANTGVYASTNGSLFSVDFGADATITVDSLEGSFGVAEVTNQRGSDLSGSIGGVSASASGVFLDVNSTFFSGQVELSGGGGQSSGAQTGAFTFTLRESGLTFQLGGAGNANESTTVSIDNMHSSNLGRTFLRHGETDSGYLSTIGSGGNNDLETNADNAVAVIDLAIADVSRQRASLGAFESINLQSNIDNLLVTAQNLEAADSAIRDADIAEESVKFVEAQVLAQASAAMLSQSNVSHQNVLDLIGGL